MRSKRRCSCVLQFTRLHAVSCVLHRPTSRVIHHSRLIFSSVLFVYIMFTKLVCIYVYKFGADQKRTAVLPVPCFICFCAHTQGRTRGRLEKFRRSKSSYFPTRNLLFWFFYFGNDPSAGSPTETLLRLLLPLSNQVWPFFRHSVTTRKPSRRPVQRPH